MNRDLRTTGRGESQQRAHDIERQTVVHDLHVAAAADDGLDRFGHVFMFRPRPRT